MLPWPSVAPASFGIQNFLEMPQTADNTIRVLPKSTMTRRQKRTQMYSPPQVGVFPSVTSTYFTVETSSSVLPPSKHLQQQQLILPKTAENIAAIAAIQQTEMLPTPAGFWRQLADCPPMPMSPPNQQHQLMIPSAISPTISPCLSSLPSPSSVTLHAQPFPSILSAQQYFRATQSQFLWMTPDFSKGITTVNGNENAAIIGAHFGGQSPGMLGSPWSMVDGKLPMPTTAIINNCETKQLQKEQNQPAIPTLLVDDRPLNKETMTTVNFQPPELALQRLMAEELEKQRHLLLLHALSPTPPAFRQQPQPPQNPYDNHHHPLLTQHQQPEYQQQQSAEQEEVQIQPNYFPSSSASAIMVSSNRIHLHRQNGDTSHIFNGAAAATTTSFLAPPELKREVDDEEEDEARRNGTSQIGEEADEEGEEGQQFTMPKLEPQTTPGIHPLQIEQEMDLDNNSQNRNDELISSLEYYYGIQEDEENINRGNEVSVENAAGISYEENTLQMPDLSFATSAPSLLPPLPPILCIRRNEVNMEDDSRHKGPSVQEERESSSASSSGSSSGNFSESSGESHLSTSSGISSADSASLEEQQQEERTQTKEQEDEEEVKENKIDVKKEEDGGKKMKPREIKKKQRRRRAPALNIRKKHATKTIKMNDASSNNQKTIVALQNGKMQKTQTKLAKSRNRLITNDVNEKEEDEGPKQPKRQRQQEQTIKIGTNIPINTKKSQQLQSPLSSSAAFPLRLSSNWRPIGSGKNQRPWPEAKEPKLCFETARHKKVSDIGIRLGDCVLVNSAEDADDVYLGRVLAIHYEPEKRALLLTLLWFYTVRQLPIRPAEANLLDPHELFASRHLDTINMDSVQGIAHVLTYAEYCRYRAQLAIQQMPTPSHKSRPWPRFEPTYPRRQYVPVVEETPPDTVFFCRGIYSIRTKRVSTAGGSLSKKTGAPNSNGTSIHGLRPCRKST